MVKYETIPECLPYHPNSELIGRPGYYPNVSADQLKAVNAFIEQIEAEELQFNTDEEHEFLKLLRFLRARKFNVEQSMKMVREDVKWRLAENRLNLRRETAEEVLGCDLTQIYNFFPTWIQGVDKQLRPVSYRKFGKFEIWNVLKLTSMERLVRFHAWETEQALRGMYKGSQESGYNIETFVLVIDAAGWGLRLATSDAYAFIKNMATTDSDHYPERLGNMLIINAPTVLSVAWKVVQGFLDPVTKKKVRILAKRSEWEPMLKQYIDVSQIPQQYGGEAPDPTPEDAISQMNPPPEGKDAEISVEMIAAMKLEDDGGAACHETESKDEDDAAINTNA
ncbi:hypothetical protein EON65_00050 [archaeon]|nr:MAG: hypothetical protein EON65_00050 [archaeon]